MDFDDYKRTLNISHPPYVKFCNKLHYFYYPKKDNLSEAQKQSISDIIDSARIIKQVLSPLEKFGINLSLSIVGGAVRDLVFNKPESISDYDFVIALEEPYKHHKELEPSNIEKFFTPNEMVEIHKKLAECTDYEEEKYNTYVWTKMVRKLIEPEISNYKMFDLHNIQEIQNAHANYITINHYIHNLYKIKDKFSKDIDLILAAFTNIAYIQTFDFEICKGCVNLDFVNQIPSEEDKFEIFIKNMMLMPNMLRDIEDKHLSIQAGRFPRKHVEYFLNKHYPRLKEKFPDYRVNLVRQGGVSYKDSEDMVKSFILQNELREEMSNNLNEHQVKKIKI